MASNPFGITQVDIPGLLGMHQQMKRQRLEDLYNARKMVIEERKAEQENRRAGVLSRIFTQPEGGGPASQAGGSPMPPSPAQPAMAQTMDVPQPQGDLITPADAAAMRASLGDERFNAWKQAKNVVEEGDIAQPSAMPTQLPPAPVRSDGLKVNPEALRELFAIDPEMAMKFNDFAGKADKAQIERVQEHGKIKALAAKYLLDTPEGPARQAAFQRIAPDLLARGFSEQDLAAADLSDRMLRKDVAFGVGLEGLISQENTDRTFEASERARALSEERARRAEGRQDRAEGRAAVRFNERGLDRAAIAASGGVRTDISDLDY